MRNLIAIDFRDIRSQQRCCKCRFRDCQVMRSHVHALTTNIQSSCEDSNETAVGYGALFDWTAKPTGGGSSVL